MASANSFAGQIGSLYENIEKLFNNNRPMNEGELLDFSEQFKRLYDFKNMLTPEEDEDEDEDEEDEDDDYEFDRWTDNGNIYLCLNKEGDLLLNNLLLSGDGKRIIGRLHHKTTIEHLDSDILAKIHRRISIPLRFD